jgi:hypothetical protein
MVFCKEIDACVCKSARACGLLSGPTSGPRRIYLRTTLGQTAMIAGEVDMCVYSGSLLSSARLQGADVVMVTSFLDKPLYRLVVRPEIRTVADLKVRDSGSRVSAPLRIR